MARTNTQTVLAFLETVFNKHEVREGFERYVGVGYLQHDARMPDGRDAAMRAWTRVLAQQYPASQVIVKRTVAQGDLVAVQLEWVPTSGQAPVSSDHARSSSRIDIYRLEKGRIIEHWGVVQDNADSASSSGAF